jgi:outer membrane protein OmpA-like peptidoglycan-associated protein
MENNMEMPEDSNWMSIADIMSALMMVFMFISVAFMFQLQQQKTSNSVEDNYKLELNKALHEEFDIDLAIWKAEITDENIFRFNSPFAVGSTHVPYEFQEILSEFFPRYVALLTQKRFKDDIAELRIEGHTSFGWGPNIKSDDNYLNNMGLSQSRASNVLDYSFRLNSYFVTENKEWLTKHVRAIGMSYSNFIYTKSGDSNKPMIEHKGKSRRVEFRVLSTNINK